MKNIEQILNEYGKNAIAEAINLLRSAGKVASGNLINSLTYDIQELMEGSYELVFSYADYGDEVDSGRKPGSFPPISSIEPWLTLRGIPEEAAFPIARSIYKFGIKPTPWLYKLQPTSKLAQDIAESQAESIAQEIVNKIQNKQ